VKSCPQCASQFGPTPPSSAAGCQHRLSLEPSFFLFCRLQRQRAHPLQLGNLLREVPRVCTCPQRIGSRGLPMLPLAHVAHKPQPAGWTIDSAAGDDS